MSQPAMDAAAAARLQALQMADLGSARREYISTVDSTRAARTRLEDLEASRLSNVAGSKESTLAEGNRKQLSAWSNLHSQIGDTDNLETLDELLHGQSHRAGLSALYEGRNSHSAGPVRQSSARGGRGGGVVGTRGRGSGPGPRTTNQGGIAKLGHHGPQEPRSKKHMLDPALHSDDDSSHDRKASNGNFGKGKKRSKKPNPAPTTAPKRHPSSNVPYPLSHPSTFLQEYRKIVKSRVPISLPEAIKKDPAPVTQTPGPQQNIQAGNDTLKSTTAVPGPKAAPASVPTKPGPGATPPTQLGKTQHNGVKNTPATSGSKASPSGVTPKQGTGATPPTKPGKAQQNGVKNTPATPSSKATQSGQAQQKGVKNTQATPGSKASPPSLTQKQGTSATPGTQSAKAQQSKYPPGIESSTAANQTPSPKPASASASGPKSGASGPGLSASSWATFSASNSKPTSTIASGHKPQAPSSGLSGSKWATTADVQKNPLTNGSKAANAAPSPQPNPANVSGPKPGASSAGTTASKWTTFPDVQKNSPTEGSKAANAAPSPKPNPANVSGPKSGASSAGTTASKWATSADDQKPPATPATKKLSAQAAPFPNPFNKPNKPTTTVPPQPKRPGNLPQPLPQTHTLEKDDTPKPTPPEGELINISSSPESTDELTTKFNSMSLMSPGTEELQGLDFRQKATTAAAPERPSSVSPLFHPRKKIDFTESLTEKTEQHHDVNPHVWFVAQSNTVIEGYTRELADLEDFLNTKTCSEVLRAPMEAHAEELKVKIRSAMQDAEAAKLAREKENKSIPRPIYGDHLLPGRRRQ